jgi:hypothetical protein
MTQDSVLEEIPVTDWNGPYPDDVRHRAAEALEAGRVLVLARLPFLISAPEQHLLDPAVLGSGRKNISFDPAKGTLSNTVANPADQPLIASMMRRFADGTSRLVRNLIPAYASQLEPARTSFRPAEIEGRVYSPRHDDRLLHVDAFPTRPLAGRRILRVFSNVAPDGADRLWRVGEPFESFAEKFLPRVKPPVPGSAQALQLLGLTKGKRRRYDHIMLQLHDLGKLDSAYQQNMARADVRFAAGTTWLCFTDQVLHAALAGHCALEQTFHLPVDAQVHPEKAPIRILERIAGRSLA